MCISVLPGVHCQPIENGAHLQFPKRAASTSTVMRALAIQQYAPKKTARFQLLLEAHPLYFHDSENIPSKYVHVFANGMTSTSAFLSTFFSNFLLFISVALISTVSQLCCR